MPLNHEKAKISFITSLRVQTVPLMRPPYLKWMALNGFLLFGTFSILNGLYVWVPDVLNRVLTGSGNGGQTACGIIRQRLNQTSENIICDDSIDTQTFIINTIANISCAVIALGISTTVKFIGKKVLLIGVLFVIGCFCIAINHVYQEMVFAVLLSSLPLTGLAIGPINAFAVAIFPTNLRGMAVSLTMMTGRTGSIIGTNVAGLMLDAACEATFYSFGGLLILCSLFSLLLPKSKPSPPLHKKQRSQLAISTRL